jgi:hypothetical protein
MVLLAGCSDLPGSCPRSSPISLARATDDTHVEITFACRVDGDSAEDRSNYAVGDFTVSPAVALEVKGASLSGEDVVVLTTAQQTALRTYTLRVDGVEDDDGNDIEASVNFTGVGQADAADVTFRVDDRYNANLTEVRLIVSIDPLTGVFSHFGQHIDLGDPDGDHVFEKTLKVAVDPARTADTGDDRLGPQHLAYTARAVDGEDRPLSKLVAFEVADREAITVEVPLLTVPTKPPPEGWVTVTFKVDDRPARALTKPSLKGSFDKDGVFDAGFPYTVALDDSDGDDIWVGTAKVRIAPERTLDGATLATKPYSAYLVEAGTPYTARTADFVVQDEDKPVEVSILVGNDKKVPVTFRVDVSHAWLDVDGNQKGVYQGEAVFLTGEFGGAEDAFGQNATDAFSGGENVVLQMAERGDHPGVWERTIFLPRDRPYGWKVLRCPKDKGCTQLNKMVTSSGRAFPTVMKNLVTELCDAGKTSWADPNCKSPRVIDPRQLGKVDTGAGVMDYSSAKIWAGAGAGLADQKDPPGTPDGKLMFKQESPDLVATVGQQAVELPVQVVGTWRDVNIPGTPADIITGGNVLDLTKTDYDAGLVGGPPPTYDLPPASKPSPFKMDGALDTTATLVAGGSGTMPIYLGLSGNQLYLATDDAGEGSDHFLLLSATAPGSPRPAPWAKAGKVAFGGKTLFLADEDESNFAGWFELAEPSDTLLEALGGSQDPALDIFTPAQNGGVLEGTVDLAAKFGKLPAMIYVAVAPWASADGGAMYSSAQTPKTKDSNGNIEAGEILKVSLPQLKVVP